MFSGGRPMARPMGRIDRTSTIDSPRFDSPRLALGIEPRVRDRAMCVWPPLDSRRVQFWPRPANRKCQNGQALFLGKNRMFSRSCPGGWLFGHTPWTNVVFDHSAEARVHDNAHAKLPSVWRPRRARSARPWPRARHRECQNGYPLFPEENHMFSSVLRWTRYMGHLHHCARPNGPLVDGSLFTRTMPPSMPIDARRAHPDRESALR
jgi:hypothetical protein